MKKQENEKEINMYVIPPINREERLKHLFLMQLLYKVVNKIQRARRTKENELVVEKQQRQGQEENVCWYWSCV